VGARSRSGPRLRGPRWEASGRVARPPTTTTVPVCPHSTAYHGSASISNKGPPIASADPFRRKKLIRVGQQTFTLLLICHILCRHLKLRNHPPLKRVFRGAAHAGCQSASTAFAASIRANRALEGGERFREVRSTKGPSTLFTRAARSVRAAVGPPGPPFAVTLCFLMTCGFIAGLVPPHGPVARWLTIWSPPLILPN
jgi:hypothetical protein